jgi:hypothetical protein
MFISTDYKLRFVTCNETNIGFRNQVSRFIHTVFRYVADALILQSIPLRGINKVLSNIQLTSYHFAILQCVETAGIRPVTDYDQSDRLLCFYLFEYSLLCA